MYHLALPTFICEKMPNQVVPEENEAIESYHQNRLRTMIFLLTVSFCLVLAIQIMVLVYECDHGHRGIKCDECSKGYYKNLSNCIEGSCNPNGTLHQDAFGACLCDAGYSGPQCSPTNDHDWDLHGIIFENVTILAPQAPWMNQILYGSHPMPGFTTYNFTMWW